MFYLRVLVFVVLSVILLGCSTVPVEQTRAFRTAVVAIQDAGNLILDDVGPAERKQWLAAHDRGAFTYDAAATYYYASITEPPQTLRLRGALKVISDYAELQLLLVEGTNVEASRAQILSIASTLSALAGAPPGVNLALDGLAPVIDQLLAAQSVLEARDQVMRGGAPLRKVIAALRNAGPEIFKTLIGPLVMRGGPDSAKAAEKARLYQRAVADFTVLLDRLEDTFDRLQLAYTDPGNVATLGALAQATGALAADVKTVRATLATLRTL